MWWYGALSFVVALCATGMIVWGARNGMPFLHDSDLSGPQKFHHRPVPRVGGVGIVVGLAAGMLGAARAFSWSEDYLCQLHLAVLAHRAVPHAAMAHRASPPARLA